MFEAVIKVTKQRIRWDYIEYTCVEQNSGFTTPFQISPDLDGSNETHGARKRFIELSSGFFPAFTMFESSQLVFKCLFRFCKDRKWCTLTQPCSSSPPQYRITPRPQSFDDIRFAMHTYEIIVNLPQRTEAIPRGEVKSMCSFFWCLPGDKLLLIISLLTVILLLVTALAFILFKRHNQFTNIHTITASGTNNPNNALQKNSLPQLTHGYYPIPDDFWKVNNYTLCSCIDDCSHLPSTIRSCDKGSFYPDLNNVSRGDNPTLKLTKKVLKQNTNIPILKTNDSEMSPNPCDGYVSLFPDSVDSTMCHNNLESTEL